MGKSEKCESCYMDYTKCKGHFGHIALVMPVVNPICLKQLKWMVKHIVITKQHHSIKNCKQAASCFHCLAPRTSSDMFHVENIEDLEEVSKILTNMCQLSETIKANNLVKKVLSWGIKSNAKDLQHLVFGINNNELKKRADVLLQVMHTRG